MAPPAQESKDGGTCVDAPLGCGLLISLDHQGICWMRFVQDRGLEFIHPHIHAPVTLKDPQELGGGGSGVTIFRGVDEEFGDVVLKHGGYKDTAELFALATIEEQLKERGRKEGAEDASEFMVRQTPDFKFLYISQDHLRDRGVELWSVVKDCMLKSPHEGPGDNSPTSMLAFLQKSVLARVRGQAEKAKKKGNSVRICIPGGSETGTRCKAPVQFVGNMLQVHLPISAEFDEQGRIQCTAPGDGYPYLQSVFKNLGHIQRTRCWKFTLAQKTIGGANPATGAALLAAGRLRGNLLETLIADQIQVMRYLQRLTLPEEKPAIDGVRRFVQRLVEKPSACPGDVSVMVDAYVGFAIKKNFHPVSGRFKKLRDLGALFRSDKLILEGPEAVPARQLGKLLQKGARVEDVFEASLAGPSAWEMQQDTWKDLLTLATSVRGEAACQRIWTCGLTDSGLHNLFLDEEALWLFDMGEPALMALPSFLTKFLMSFFHTLGMEETSCGTWVNRFVLAGEDKVRLSPATTALLPQVYTAFRAVLDRLVQEVFEGEAAVRALLVRYTVLQLLSDAAFCLERWGQKGGGAERLRPEARSLEKWLWRALWDIYVATDVAGQEDWRGAVQ